jgi:transcriptional regulator with XRE-family HTH domain
MDMVRRWGWSLSHYQKIERGALDLRLSTVAWLAECFGISLSQLMRGL